LGAKTQTPFRIDTLFGGNPGTLPKDLADLYASSTGLHTIFARTTLRITTVELVSPCARKPEDTA
jgi:hypothetical protein